MGTIKEDLGEIVGIWFSGEFLCFECTVKNENITLSELGQECIVFSGIEGEDERCDRCKNKLYIQNARTFLKELEVFLGRGPSQLWENATTH